MADTVHPFMLEVPQTAIDDLHRRLDLTRWPDREVVDNWSQGAPLEKVRALCDHWRHRYDWRACENRLNELGQFKTVIDGVGIHFIHVRSPHADARPLLLTHGWPGSVVEFLKVVSPLTDPTRHGGEARDAFHLVIPSLPGYGFSDKPTEAGRNVAWIAAAWGELMKRLGYTSWFAQGGDWGSAVTNAIGHMKIDGCIGIHVNMCITTAQQHEMPDLSDAEKAAVASIRRYYEVDSGYALQQSTRPQTLGYGLADSPAAQAAWIYEKMWSWTDNDGLPEDALTSDEILDNIMLYWLTNSATSSARLYWESIGKLGDVQIDLPMGISVFPKEFWRGTKRWMSQIASNIVHFNEVERGGHFAAWEEPDIFVDELRSCFRKM